MCGCGNSLGGRSGESSSGKLSWMEGGISSSSSSSACVTHTDPPTPGRSRVWAAGMVTRCTPAVRPHATVSTRPALTAAHVTPLRSQAPERHTVPTSSASACPTTAAGAAAPGAVPAARTPPPPAAAAATAGPAAPPITAPALKSSNPLRLSCRMIITTTATIFTTATLRHHTATAAAAVPLPSPPPPSWLPSPPPTLSQQGHTPRPPVQRRLAAAHRPCRRSGLCRGCIRPRRRCAGTVAAPISAAHPVMRPALTRAAAQSG